MIVGVVIDFERLSQVTFSKLLGKIMILFSKFQYLKRKKLGCGPLKNSGEQSRTIFAFLTIKWITILEQISWNTFDTVMPLFAIRTFIKTTLVQHRNYHGILLLNHRWHKEFLLFQPIFMPPHR